MKELESREYLVLAFSYIITLSIILHYNFNEKLSIFTAIIAILLYFSVIIAFLLHFSAIIAFLLQ